MIRGAKRGLTWDLAAAMRAITFFPVVLRLNGGQFEGRKFDLHPSQAFRIGSLFGWKQAGGTRRFRRFYDEEGKGNGKSPLLAGIGLYCLLADGDPPAQRLPQPSHPTPLAGTSARANRTIRRVAHGRNVTTVGGVNSPC